MARIRTIKPEFPQSESMGRVGRESRLLFVLLWTLADDAGRLRGDSRMLASLLYPYDEDAPQLILAWISELEREQCIHRYIVEGHNFLQILNWSSHQKIDKPSKSKFPDPRESSRTFANPREEGSEGSNGLRERSSEDQGSRIKDQDQGPVPVPARANTSEESETDIRRRIDAIKAVYPQAARQDWITAEKLIRNIVASGTAWSDLTEGITRYARLCTATNRVAQNPGMFFQAVDEPWLQEWPIPSLTGLPRMQAPPRDNSAAWAELEAKAKAIGCRPRAPTDTLDSYRTEVLLAERPKPGASTHPGLAALTNKLRRYS